MLIINDSYEPAILILEDGTVFKGKSVGHKNTTIGELCFNTGMTGYQETFTDPSYYGQILISTHVHIGNYGTSKKEIESDSVKIAGLICRSFSKDFSRIQADKSLQDYFEENKIVGISEVDTRAIVRHIRSKGAMNGIISSVEFDEAKLMEELRQAPSMDGLELASKVSTEEIFDYGDNPNGYKVAVMDYGCKKNILRSLAGRGFQLRIFPARTPFEKVNEWNPDGYFLSNGPGDPAPMDYAITSVQKMLDTDKPVFGICLGHQLLSLAVGIPTYKMHHGHRGANHPVKNLETGLCEITSQNHGFGVDADQIRSNADKVRITHINLNDDTIEGIELIGKRAFSVQYHPEASPGPHDASYLFDKFYSLF